VFAGEAIVNVLWERGESVFFDGEGRSSTWG